MQSSWANYDFIFWLYSSLPQASGKYQGTITLPIFHAKETILVFILMKETVMIERLINFLDRSPFFEAILFLI